MVVAGGSGASLTAPAVELPSRSEPCQKHSLTDAARQKAIRSKMNPPNDSPLALRFEEALQPTVFLSQLRTAAENQTKRELEDLANDALKSALAGAKFVLDRNGMQVVFEGGIPKGAKLMCDVAGKALPTLVDGKTGRALKIARGVSSSRKVVSTTAGAALVIVEAAHMISGYDNAQRLKKVERAADALLHAHKSELKSRLKAIYGHCQELINGDLNQLSEHDRSKLHDQCLTLRELRDRWRADFEHRLRGIKPAEAGWMNRVLWWKREEGHRRNREEKAKEAGDTLEIIQLMHFSLMLQMILAGASGRMEAFEKTTLTAECKSWRELMEFTSKRATEICGNNEAEEFKPFLEAMADFVEIWSPDRWADDRKRLVLDREGRNVERKEKVARTRAKGAAKASAALIVIACPSCGKSLRVPADRGRLNVTCPDCTGQFGYDPGKD